MGQIGQWVTSSEEASQEWENIIQESQNNLLDTLRDSDEIIVFPKIKKILEFKLKKLEELSPDDLDLHTAPEETAKFNLIDKYLCDCVYNEFKIEEQTFNFSLRYLKDSQKDEIDQLLQKVTDKTRDLLFGEEDESQGEEK